MRGVKRCLDCDQPMLRKGQKRDHPDAYKHAAGCPSDDASPSSLLQDTTLDVGAAIGRIVIDQMIDGLAKDDGVDKIVIERQLDQVMKSVTEQE